MIEQKAGTFKPITILIGVHLVFAVIGGALFFFVLPDMRGLFEEYGIDLPGATALAFRLSLIHI